MDKRAALSELKKRQEISLALGGEERIERQHKRGRLTARERIDKLVDPGSFTETGMLTLFQMPGEDENLIPRNKLHGYGRIDGRIVSIQSDDSTVLAGTGGRGPVGRARSASIPREAQGGCPIIRFGESGGVHLQSTMGSIGLLAVTYPTSRLMNPRRVPRIIGIMGNCFGDPSWQAANSEFVVQVKGTCMAVSGPRVLDVALDEKITPEQLGGWKVHAEVTGQVDAFAEDDAHCARIIRDIVSYIPNNCDEEPPFIPTDDKPDRMLDELTDLIPDSPEQAYDMYPVIQAIVDDGKYFDIKPFFGKAVITCLARINGGVAGIIANQTMHNSGALGVSECEKATNFIAVCDSFNIPLVFLVDTPGFLVGKQAEEKRLITKMMTWLQAMTLSTVPRISLVVRKAWGMASANMCGPSGNPDFVAGLTTSDYRSMSPQAELNMIHRHSIEKSANPEAEKAKLTSSIESTRGPWNAAGSGLIDDLIDPRDTRKYIIEHLDVLRSQRGNFIGEHRLQTWPVGF